MEGQSISWIHALTLFTVGIIYEHNGLRIVLLVAASFNVLIVSFLQFENEILKSTGSRLRTAAQ